MTRARATPLPLPSPQREIDNFWKSHLSSAATPPPSVLPPGISSYVVDETCKCIARGRPVTECYETVVKECEAKVAQIIAECARTNAKYTDLDFDLDNMYDCLVALNARPSDAAPNPEKVHKNLRDDPEKVSLTGERATGDSHPGSPGQSASVSSIPACARRVGWIFDKPQFYVNKKAHVRDIRQGAEGDCWFISSLGSLCVDTEVPHLIENVCPSSCRDEKVGVYGFVFHRDGEWISEVIDDKLYIRVPDYDDCTDARRTAWDSSHSLMDPELSRKLWKQAFQSNSEALYFASCAHPQETWVPLVEKAFAKAHGDFAAIDGGWPGEGVEDLTGGITTEVVSADIRDRDQLWNEGFLNVNKEFLIGAGTRQYRYPDPHELGRQGIEDGHAYSVLRAVDYSGERLLMVKNPWGRTEWTGPWSDGSQEWTAQALKDLDYTFGNEGIFWMPYTDFLQRFVQIWCTRLFSPEWRISQHWTTIQVPWSGGYTPTIFEFTLTSSSRTVIALSQLDSRYFGGLTGQYFYELAFRLQMHNDEKYIIRGYSSGDRSAVAEVDLKPGTYVVLMKVQAFRDSTQPTITDVITQSWLSRRDKLIRSGIAYDTAHAKGQTKTSANKRKKIAKAITKDAALVALGHLDDPPATKTAASAQGEPWNASLVIGLRVFCCGTAATIRVVDLNNQNWWRRKRWSRQLTD